MHNGFFTGEVPLVLIWKLAAAVLAVTLTPPVNVESVELQTTPSFAPNVASACTKIWLSPLTTVVFTVTVVAPTAITTLPAAADPQTAGEAEDEQFELVE